METFRFALHRLHVCYKMVNALYVYRVLLVLMTTQSAYQYSDVGTEL